MTRLVLLAAVGCVALFGAGGALLGGWILLAAGAQTASACEPTTTLDAHAVPAELQPLFQGAAERYHLGPQGAAILAGLTQVESDFGRNKGPSSAGAVGWTQFMPETWRRYGVDADGDGHRDPMSAADAIASAARYLQALGAPADWHRALFGYNHAEWYVDQVLQTARSLAAGGSAPEDELAALTCSSLGPDTSAIGPGGRVVGGGRIVPVPWQPGITIDERLLTDLQLLHDRFHIALSAGYAATGHDADGEHPLGLAVDIVPGAGGTWDDIDELAHLAEPQQDHPIAPWRWVGYDGDPNHGRGNHLHLSWLHGDPAPGHRPPAAWVQVMAATP